MNFDTFQDETGSAALSDENPVVDAVRKLKTKFRDDLLVAVDICLCPYSSTGHCGVFDDKGELIIPKSIEILAEMAYKMAQVGADIVAPSGTKKKCFAKLSNFVSNHG